MKQKEDDKTIDMWGEGKPSKGAYMFYIRTATAQTEWTGLTKKQARGMYAYTDKHQPSNVTAFGWEEIKSWGAKGATE